MPYTFGLYGANPKGFSVKTLSAFRLKEKSKGSKSLRVWGYVVAMP